MFWSTQTNSWYTKDLPITFVNQALRAYISSAHEGYATPTTIAADIGDGSDIKTKVKVSVHAGSNTPAASMEASIFAIGY